MRESDDFIPTRKSLLNRLKDSADQESWQLFFDTYWRLIYKTAVESGLTDAEAQEVVQETMIRVWKKMPTFQYDAAKGSFKSWLLQLTGWRITAQLRKRRPSHVFEDCSTLEIENVPDPETPLEDFWDEEWEKTLLEAAMERLKRKIRPGHYQIFDLHVCKKWPASKLAKCFEITEDQVYVIKHRVRHLLAIEMDRIRTQII